MNKAINRVASVVLAGITILVVTSYGFFEPDDAAPAIETTMIETTETFATIETTGNISIVTENTSGNLVPREQVLGVMTGAGYRNDFFGFDLTLPTEWHIADEADYNFLMKDALKDVFRTLSESDQVDVSTIAMLPMLYALKHPVDYKEGPNASLMINGESLNGQQTMIQSSEIYLSIKKARLNQTSAYEYSDTTTFDIGGVPFSLMTMTTEINGIAVSQSVYAAMKQDFVLDIVITFFSEEEKKELEAMLETIQFD